MNSGRQVTTKWVELGLLALGVLVAIACGGYNLLAGTLACSLDNSNCAHSGKPVRYGGRLFTSDGRPVGTTTVSVSFETLHDSPDERPVSFHTDRQGRFCFLWPREAITPFVYAPNATPAAPTDARFRHPEELIPVLRRLSGVEQLHPDTLVLIPDPGAGTVSLLGGYSAERGWNSSTDRAQTCETADRSPPWYRIEEPTRNFRYVLLFILPFVSIALILWALLERPGRRRRRTLVTLSAVGVQAILTVIFWQLYVVAGVGRHEFEARPPSSPPPIRSISLTRQSVRYSLLITLRRSDTSERQVLKADCRSAYVCDAVFQAPGKRRTRFALRYRIAPQPHNVSGCWRTTGQRLLRRPADPAVLSAAFTYGPDGPTACVQWNRFTRLAPARSRLRKRKRTPPPQPRLTRTERARALAIAGSDDLFRRITADRKYKAYYDTPWIDSDRRRIGAYLTLSLNRPQPRIVARWPVLEFRGGRIRYPYRVNGQRLTARGLRDLQLYVDFRRGRVVSIIPEHAASIAPEIEYDPSPAQR